MSENFFKAHSRAHSVHYSLLHEMNLQAGRIERPLIAGPEIMRSFLVPLTVLTIIII